MIVLSQVFDSGYVFPIVGNLNRLRLQYESALRKKNKCLVFCESLGAFSGISTYNYLVSIDRSILDHASEALTVGL